MSQQNSTDSYRNPLRYRGQDYSFVPFFSRNRDPSSPTNQSNDIRPKENKGYYPIPSLWANSTNNNIWLLTDYIKNPSLTPGGNPNLGNWVLISSGNGGPLINFLMPDGVTKVFPNASGQVNITQSGTAVVTGTPGTNTINFAASGSGGVTTQLVPDTGTSPITPDGSNNITVLGGTTLATGTLAKAIRSNGVSAHEMDLQLQLAGSNANTSTANNFGISQFDSNQFTVTSGFVQLKGAVSPTLPSVQTLTGNTGGAVGPDSSGNINLTGNAVAASATPITVMGGSHAEQIQVQAASQQASGSLSNAGLASFNSTQFSVAPSTGFVSLVGGTSPGTSIPIFDVAVPNGTTPVFPTAAGQLTLSSTDSSVTITGSPNTINLQLNSSLAPTFLTGDDSVAVHANSGNIGMQGATVTNGTSSKALYTTGNNTTHIETINIQVAAAKTATDITKAGIASFKDTQFAVDTNGFVTLAGGTTPALLNVAVPNGSTPVVPTSSGLMTFSSSDNSVTITGSPNTINFQTTPGVGTSLKTQDGTTVAPSSGVINVSGAIIAAAGTPVISSGNNGTHTATVNVQTASAQTSSSNTNAGLASFTSTQFNVDSNGFVSFLPFQVYNIGFNITAGTFTVTGANGTALSTTNPGYVTTPDPSNPGQSITYKITNPYQFTDANGSGNLTGNSFGISATAWAQDKPFFLYFISNSAGTHVSAAIGALPGRCLCSSTGGTAIKGSAVASGQNSMYLLDEVISGTPTAPTAANYGSQPCVYAGMFRMQASSTTFNWRVQSLNSQKDGINKFFPGPWTMPTAQMGAKTGSFFYSTVGGDTMPTFNTQGMSYTISQSGIVDVSFGTDFVTGAGVGTGVLRWALPYTTAYSGGRYEFCGGGNINNGGSGTYVGYGLKMVDNPGSPPAYTNIYDIPNQILIHSADVNTGWTQFVLSCEYPTQIYT